MRAIQRRQPWEDDRDFEIFWRYFPDMSAGAMRQMLAGLEVMAAQIQVGMKAFSELLKELNRAR